MAPTPVLVLTNRAAAQPAGRHQRGPLRTHAPLRRLAVSATAGGATPSAPPSPRLALAGPSGRGSAAPAPSHRHPVGRSSYRPRSTIAASSKPSSSSDAPPVARTLPALRAALELAVAEEDYAEAARLRDAMNDLEADARFAVEDANARFYAAFRSGSASAMAAAWGAGDHVQVIHPGGGCIAGREAVLESWSIVTGGAGLDIGLRDVRVLAPPGSPVAVVTCLELVDVGDARGRNVATNVFEWQADEDEEGGESGGVVGGPGGAWKLVLHHASPAPRPVMRPAQGRL